MPPKKKFRLSRIKKVGRRRKPDPVIKHTDADVTGEHLDDRLERFFILSEDLDSCHSCDSNIIETSAEYVDSDGFQANEFYVILDKPYKYCADTNLDEFVADEHSRVFSELREDCKQQIQDTQFVYMSQCKDLKYIELYDSDAHCPTPRVKSCVTIGQDFSVSIHVHGRPIPDNHCIWESIGHMCYTVNSVKNILNELSKYDICYGNQDSNLQDLVPVGTYVDVDKKGYKYQGYRESFYVGSTIRATRCSLVISSRSKLCVHCQTYRRTLKKTLMRRQNAPKIATPHKDWTKSHISNTNLTENQKIHKIKQLKSYSLKLESEVEQLKSQIRKKIKTEGVALSDSLGKDMAEMMDQSEQELLHSFPDEYCYQRVFWDQQKKYANLNNKCGMRWHPAIIKWCIYLKSKSSTTYDTLRNSGFVKLPSERTLFDYTNVTKKGTGFQVDTVEMLINETEKFEGHKRIVGILQDEIRIKQDLVYDRSSGELIGFIDLGSISNQLMSMNENDESDSLAKFVLVLMVRGVSSNLKFPLAHFATRGVTSDQLFCILWEGVEILECVAGLEVLYITSDGASPNRRFIRLHSSGQSTVFKANNIFAPQQRDIYFISDPPHLIKTIRNCFSNSYSHKMTRKLWKDGRDISWMFVVDLYKEKCNGIYRLCNKLTKDHINITSFGAMKVRLAAQVMSATVATALETHYDQRVTETVQFIRHVNKFFDCVNVRSLGEAARTRNQNMSPYTSVDDPRLAYMTGEFLLYFQEWKRSVENRPGAFSKSERNAMMLSYQTLQGIEITVKSIVNCVKYCLNRGMDFVLTEHFNQDPVEQHFAIHRASLGSNTNPRLQDFNHSMVKIRTVGSQAIAPFRGNTRRRIDLTGMDHTPLPNRKRHNSM